MHTADGISIRFPRVTRIRRDKDWSTATTLNELRELFRKRPESIDFSLLLGMSDVADESDGKPSNLLNTSVSSEPSTSYMNRAAEIKEEPPNTTEELSKGRKRNRTADGTKSSTKRSRVTKRDIKDESEDEQKKEKFSLTRAKKVKVEPNLLAVKKEEKREDPCVDRLVEEMDTEEFFERETNTFDVEDSVSNEQRAVSFATRRSTWHVFFSLTKFLPGIRRPEERTSVSRVGFRQEREEGRAKNAQDVSFLSCNCSHDDNTLATS